MNDDDLTMLLRRTRADHFGPGFTARLLARTAHTPALGAALRRGFVWLAPVAVAAILLLAVYNIRQSSGPAVDRALGLPVVSLDAAYAVDVR